MRGVYTLRETLTSVTAADHQLWMQPPSDEVVEILSAKVTSPDGTSGEDLHCKLGLATGTVGGGDALTPEPHEQGDGAWGGTAKGNNTAITGMTSEGDDVAFANHSEKIDSGWDYDPLPEERKVVPPSGQLMLETKTTLTSCTLICEIVFRAIG